MKKLYLLFILLILPISVFAKNTCDSNNIRIQSITLEDTRGNIEEVSAPSSDDGKIHLDLKMNVVGDFAEYKIILKNTSDEEYYFDEKSLNLNTSYVDYEVQYEDGSNLIKSGEDKIITLKVAYKDKVASSNLENGLYSDNQVLKLYLSDKSIINDLIDNPITSRNYIFIIIIGLIIGFILINKKYRKSSFLLLVFLTIPFTVKALCRHTLEIETNLVIDGKEAIFLPGKEVNAKMKQLAGDDLSTVTNGFSFLDQSITSILKSNVEPDEINKEEKNVVSTSESSYPIYMWYEDGTIYWWSEDKTPALNESSNYFFSRLSNLVNITGLSSFDASNSSNFDYIFRDNLNLSDIFPLANWNTSKVETMKNGFFRMRSLTNTDAFKNWDTSNVVNMASIFSYCSSLNNIDGLKDWDISNVVNMASAFYTCSSLNNIDGLKNWDTSNVVNMASIFSYCSSLSSIDGLKDWNVKNLKDLSNAFVSCVNLEVVDFSGWETSSLENFHNTFAMWDSNGYPVFNSKLRIVKLSDKFDTSKVNDMYALFANNGNIEDYSFLKYIDTKSVEDMSQMLQFNTNFRDVSLLKNWDVSNVKNMEGFLQHTSINSLDGLEEWNVSNVTNMKFMFRDSQLTDISRISNWDVSNVSSFSYMFSDNNTLSDASSINDWNISSTALFINMFLNTPTHPDFTRVQGTWDSNGTFNPNS